MKKEEKQIEKVRQSSRETQCTDRSAKERTGEGMFNTKIKDSSAKLIFDDPILCAQFLRDYIDIPLLKDVRPEDIEDVTERFVHMFTEERNSDVVKKVWIRNEQVDEIPFYFISLIEHKSKVDYNVIMQIFRYIVFIWEDYEKEMERRYPGIFNTKDFKYPPVLPIIFYDGDGNWTAATRLHDRVLLSEIFGEYIPDYRCIVMKLRDYTNEALREKRNALSIVMLIDKLQDMEEFSAVWEELEPEYMKEVAEKSPEYLLKIVAHVVEMLLAKLNVPREEAEAFTEQIRERHMGELLANFKGYDVQATRKEVREETREEVIGQAIHIMKKLNVDKETAIEQLMEEFGFGRDDASKKVELNYEQIRERHMGELLANFKGYDVQATRKEAREKGREEAREEDISKLIQIMIELNVEGKMIIKQLMDKFGLSESDAMQKVKGNWRID